MGIFAIVQKNCLTSAVTSSSQVVTTGPLKNQITLQKTEPITSLRISKPEEACKVINTTHSSLDDHDYIEEEETFETTGVSKGFGPGLSLTDEEKKLLDLENILIPEDAPLTKEEEKALKRI